MLLVFRAYRKTNDTFSLAILHAYLGQKDQDGYYAKEVFQEALKTSHGNQSFGNKVLSKSKIIMFSLVRSVCRPRVEP